MAQRSKSEWTWSFYRFMKNTETMPNDKPVSFSASRKPNWEKGVLSLWVRDEISQLKSEERTLSMDIVFDMEPDDRDQFISKVHAEQADELMTLLRVMWRMEVA